MGWYREYLEDLAEIAAEKAREELELGIRKISSIQ